MTGTTLKHRLKLSRKAFATASGLKKQGFFTPFRHAASVPAPPPVYAELEAIFAAAVPQFGETLTQISQYVPDLRVACDGPLAGHWDGGYFGPLDTAATYAITRSANPSRIIEVGSGSSTHVLSAAAEACAADCCIRCIDPIPRHEISELGVTWDASVLTDAHVAQFAELGSGDIAFFDSSHVLFEGTDVDIIQNRILPSLQPGVLVHIHDIFLPDAYPVEWDHRAYTEQIGLGGWLCGGAYSLIFASHYVSTRMADRAAETLAELAPSAEPGGGSIWLQRN